MKNLFPLALLLSVSNISWADTTYEVRRGDTIYKISDRFLGKSGTDNRTAFAHQILAANPNLENPDIIEPGMKIQVPVRLARKTHPQTAAASYEDGSREVAELVRVPESPAAEEPVKPEPIPEAKESHPPEHREVAESEEEEEGNFAEIRARAEHTEYKIKSEELNEDLKVNTKISPSINFLYGKKLMSKLHLLVEAGVTHAQFNSFSDAQVSADPTKAWLRNFGVGLEYEIAEPLRAELTAQFVDRFFFLPRENNTYYLSRVMIPEAELILSWSFWRMHQWALGVAGEVEFNTTVHHDNTAFKSTFDPAAALYWETKYGAKNTNYRVSATWSTDAQHADNQEQDANIYGLNLQVIFPI